LESEDAIRGAMDECERFAAAAIAFTWRHDPQFRSRFWKNVCSFDGDPSLTDRSEILVEPYRWADLLITNRTRHGLFVYVVELKIRAELSNIQNPTKREFGLADGYGSLFAANFAPPRETLRFVLLGAKPLGLGKRPWTLPIGVHQRSWKDLADNFPTTSVSKDLAISLGILGIHAFPAAEVKNMKVDIRDKELAKATSILREVERRLDWPQSRTKREFGFEEGYWFLGVELQPSEPGKSLQDLVQPPWNYVAWFGYDGEEGAAPSLGVWFYCGSRERRAQIASKLRHKLKGCSIDDTAPPEDKQFNLIVRARRHTFNNDSEWFCNVFRSLGVQVLV
jgi:hypothetical protein